MQELVLHRALNPTQRNERLVQVNPSLSMRTLHHQVAGGRQVSLQRWTGSKRALGLVRREEADVVSESRDGLLLFVAEKAAHPADLMERVLGPETLATLELSGEGATWRILTRAEGKVAAFLRAVREAEDAIERQEGAGMPRFASRRGSAAAAFDGSPRLLAPLERAVLAQAEKLGYFERPRKAGIAEVGKVLKMPPTTALYHLRAAQRKLVKDALRP